MGYAESEENELKRWDVDIPTVNGSDDRNGGVKHSHSANNTNDWVIERTNTHAMKEREVGERERDEEEDRE